MAIVGPPGPRAEEPGEEPGNDRTYLAENNLVPGLELPATLDADMAGSLMASEAVLQAACRHRERAAGSANAHAQPEAVHYHSTMARIVGKQDRSEFILDPVLALRRGRQLDAMLAGARLPRIPGITRAPHHKLNEMDDQRQLEIARRLNTPR